MERINRSLEAVHPRQGIMISQPLKEKRIPAPGGKSVSAAWNRTGCGQSPSIDNATPSMDQRVFHGCVQVFVGGAERDQGIAMERGLIILKPVS